MRTPHPSASPPPSPTGEGLGLYIQFLMQKESLVQSFSLYEGRFILFSERILGRILVAGRAVIADLFYSEIFEDLNECLAEVTERDGTVVREAVLNQHVTVEASHLRNREDTDATEALRFHGQNLTLRNIGIQVIVRGALQTEEGNVPGNDVTLQRSVGNLNGQRASHDLLILHRRLAELL